MIDSVWVNRRRGSDIAIENYEILLVRITEMSRDNVWD